MSAILFTGTFFHTFLSSAAFIQIQLFSKYSFRNTTKVSNSFDPSQTRHFDGPGLGQNFLQRLSADGNRRQTVKLVGWGCDHVGFSC